MAKSRTSSKSLGAYFQSKTIYKIAPCNLQAVFDASLYNPILAPLIEALNNHSLLVPLTITKSKFPFSYLIKAHDTAKFDDNLDRVQLQLLNNNTIFLLKHIFIESIELPRSAICSRYENPSTTQVFHKLLEISHKPPLETTNSFKKSRLPITWNFLFHIIIRYLTRMTRGTDQLSTAWLQIL